MTLLFIINVNNTLRKVHKFNTIFLIGKFVLIRVLRVL